jgi:predicted GH43/DUF377 family glycosyl hydrolase
LTGLERPQLVRRTPHVLRPDPSRVVSTDFFPAEDVPSAGTSRTDALLDRVLALSDADVIQALTDTSAAFGERHRDLSALFGSRFDRVAHHLADPARLSIARRLLIGAYLSQEYAVEAAAVFNPAMVEHPDQSGLEPGTVRFVMSLRGVGEGHVSCIEFRTGTIDSANEIQFDQPGSTMALPRKLETQHSRMAFERYNAELAGDPCEAAAVLDSLPAAFASAELDAAIDRWRARGPSPEHADRTAVRLVGMAALMYTIEFSAETPIDARVILPGSPAESHGVEDLRLVRFTAADGCSSYLGTYTAFDGVGIAPHLLRTTDLATFELSRLSGSAAKNKGMALFPRTVGGKYLALSRWDRENNTLATSDDLLHWEDAGVLSERHLPWEIVQTGNSGAPLETSAGWLVLTHGVGPMRQYSIGAMLLDLHDPRKVIGSLEVPLLTPLADERDGYVPNIVYSCGALLHGDTLVLPYGASDATIRICLIDVPELLAMLRPPQARRM